MKLVIEIHAEECEERSTPGRASVSEKVKPLQESSLATWIEAWKTAGLVTSDPNSRTLA